FRLFVAPPHQFVARGPEAHPRGPRRDRVRSARTGCWHTVARANRTSRPQNWRSRSERSIRAAWHPGRIRTILLTAPAALPGGFHASNVPTRCPVGTLRIGRTCLPVSRRCPAARREWRRRGRAWRRGSPGWRSGGPRRPGIWWEPRGGSEDASSLFLLPAVLLSPLLLSPVLLRVLPALIFARVVQSDLRVRLVRGWLTAP